MKNEEIEFIPYGKQTITDSDIEAVRQVLKSPYLTQGPTVEIFEQEVARKVNAKYGIAVNSATSALHIACMALGAKKRRLPLDITDYLCGIANCGRYCDAEIDFVDIDPSTGLMSVRELAKKLEIASRANKLRKS